MVTHRFGKYPIVRIDRDGSTNMGLYDLTGDEVALLEGLGPGVYVLSPELSDYAGVFSRRGGNWVDALPICWCAHGAWPDPWRGSEDGGEVFQGALQPVDG